MRLTKIQRDQGKEVSYIKFHYYYYYYYYYYSNINLGTEITTHSSSNFFRLNLAKRSRNNTITDFNKEEGLLKVLTFIIQNNILFNALNSNSFQDLIKYYNKYVFLQIILFRKFTNNTF